MKRPGHIAAIVAAGGISVAVEVGAAEVPARCASRASSLAGAAATTSTSTLSPRFRGEAVFDLVSMPCTIGDRTRQSRPR
jgi:hypothetical protein